MQVHLHVDLSEICPIGWADTQVSILTDYRQKGVFFCPITSCQSNEGNSNNKHEKAQQLQEESTPGPKPLAPCAYQ